MSSPLENARIGIVGAGYAAARGSHVTTKLSAVAVSAGEPP